MKKAIALLIIIALLFTACSGGSSPEQSLNELLSLGEQYLLELEYEQALVQFLKAIEVEPMNPRGYTGAAEAYVGLGDDDSAADILRRGIEETGDAGIQGLLDGFAPLDDVVDIDDVTETAELAISAIPFSQDNLIDFLERTKYPMLICDSFTSEADPFSVHDDLGVWAVLILIMDWYYEQNDMTPEIYIDYIYAIEELQLVAVEAFGAEYDFSRITAGNYNDPEPIPGYLENPRIDGYWGWEFIEDECEYDENQNVVILPARMYDAFDEIYGEEWFIQYEFSFHPEQVYVPYRLLQIVELER